MMKISDYIKGVSVGLSAVMMIAGMPVIPTAAADAPILRINSISITSETIPENRTLEVELVLTNNSGFRACSFGIEYDPSLVYTQFTPTSNAGLNFDVVCNSERNLMWLMCAGSSAQANANSLMEETVLKLCFQIPPEVTGGKFPINFVWTGLDGSSAYWYTDTSTNVISDIQSTAVNGSIDLHGGSTLNYVSLRMNQESQQQLVLENAASVPIWISTNPAVASVDQDGLVTALSAGECDIQAFIDNQFEKCHVVVNENDIYSILDTDELVLVNPKRGVVMEFPGASGSVSWISGNPSAIHIDPDTGKLEIMNPGTDCSSILFGTDLSTGATYMRNVTVQYTGMVVDPSETVKFAGITPGDVNNDDSIDILDVIMVNKAILGKIILTDEQNIAADFNQDGSVTAADSLDILKYIVDVD